MRTQHVLALVKMSAMRVDGLQVDETVVDQLS
jgi:hypothetical protein